MKNEKTITMNKRDFEEMRKDTELNSSKDFQIESNIVINVFRGKTKDGEEFGESFSRFYITDKQGNHYVGLCTLQELDYVEINKENKVTIVATELIKTVIDEYGNFVEFWASDGAYYKKGDKLATKKCTMCGTVIPMFGEVMCCDCEGKYEYNLNTDEFELVKSKTKNNIIADENIDMVNREIKEYQHYVDLFVSVYSGNYNYLNWLKILDSGIVNRETKREILYGIAADRREFAEDYSQEKFDLQILKTLLLRFPDEHIDMIFEDIKNQLFEKGMQENYNI